MERGASESVHGVSIERDVLVASPDGRIRPGLVESTEVAPLASEWAQVFLATRPLPLAVVGCWPPQDAVARVRIVDAVRTRFPELAVLVLTSDAVGRAAGHSSSLRSERERSRASAPRSSP